MCEANNNDNQRPNNSCNNDQPIVNLERLMSIIHWFIVCDLTKIKLKKKYSYPTVFVY